MSFVTKIHAFFIGFDVDHNLYVQEEIVYEEISEEEAGITRRQFLTKALRISFGAFAGIQILTYLGFLWPKISGGFGGKVDAGLVSDLKKQEVNYILDCLKSFDKNKR